MEQRRLIITQGAMEGVELPTAVGQQLPLDQGEQQQMVSGLQLPLSAEGLSSGQTREYTIRPDQVVVDGPQTNLPSTIPDAAPGSVTAAPRSSGVLVPTDVPGGIPAQRSLDTLPADQDRLRRHAVSFADKLAAERSVPQTGIWQRFMARLTSDSDSGPHVTFDGGDDGHIEATWRFHTERTLENRLPDTQTRIVARTALRGLLSRAEERRGASTIWDAVADVLDAGDEGKKAKVKPASLLGVKGKPVRNWRLARRHEYNETALSNRIGSVILESSGVQIDTEVRSLESETDSQMHETLLHTIVNRPERTPKTSIFNRLTGREVLEGALRYMGLAGFKGAAPRQIPTAAVDRYLTQVQNDEYHPRQKDRTVSPQFAALETTLRYMPMKSDSAETTDPAA